MPAPVCTVAAPVVIGLVLVLESSRPVDPLLRAQLHACSELYVGAQQGAWMSCTTVTTDPRQTHAWLESLPGVRAVEVVFTEIVPPNQDGDAGDSRSIAHDGHQVRNRTNARPRQNLRSNGLTP